MGIIMFFYDAALGLNDGVAPMIGPLISSMRVKRAKKVYRVVQFGGIIIILGMVSVLYVFRFDVLYAITDKQLIRDKASVVL